MPRMLKFDWMHDALAAQRSLFRLRVAGAYDMTCSNVFLYDSCYCLWVEDEGDECLIH